MLLQLQPKQISNLWDLISFAVFQVDRVPPDIQDECANKVLVNLLTGKFQAWVVMADGDEGRQIHAITITSLQKNELMGYDYFRVNILYGLRPLTEELAREAIEGFKTFARAAGCVRIIAQTTHPRVHMFANLTGFEELGVEYCINL